MGRARRALRATARSRARRRHEPVPNHGGARRRGRGRFRRSDHRARSDARDRRRCEHHHDRAQRLSRAEAIRLHTIGSARIGHQEDKKGALAPGMHADFAAFDADPFDRPRSRACGRCSRSPLAGRSSRRLSAGRPCHSFSAPAVDLAATAGVACGPRHRAGGGARGSEWLSRERGAPASRPQRSLGPSSFPWPERESFVVLTRSSWFMWRSCDGRTACRHVVARASSGSRIRAHRGRSDPSEG